MKKQTYTHTVDEIVKAELNFTVYGEGSPKVFFTGGIHGGESTGIYVAQRVMKFIEENGLQQGTVKVLPIANPTAFRRLQRTSPYDELDMNRIFPGREGSAPTLEVANVIWKEALDQDYIVDLHCCGVHGASYTLAVYNEFDYAKDLASMLSIPRIIESGGTRGQLFVNACEKGIPAVIIELPGGGQGGVIDLDAAEECYQALINLLRQFGMVAGEAVKPTPAFYGKLQPVQSKIAGAFLPAVKVGEPIEEGQVLGTVNGKPVLSPVTGTSTAVRPASYVFKGNSLANVAPLAE